METGRMITMEFREFRKEDTPALEGIIRKTWNYDKFAGPKTAQKLARVFLSSCLANQTFSQVAVENGKPVGIILGKNIAVHKCPLSYRWKQICSLVSLYLTKEGRNASEIFGSVNGIDKELLATCRPYPAELALFVISPDCRGKGVGKQLYQRFLQYLKKEHLDSFYLYTDTSCNYGFYEHQGMVRRCKKEHIFTVNQQRSKMTFFIYDCEI